MRILSKVFQFAGAAGMIYGVGLIGGAIEFSEPILLPIMLFGIGTALAFLGVKIEEVYFYQEKNRRRSNRNHNDASRPYYLCR